MMDSIVSNYSPPPFTPQSKKLRPLNDDAVRYRTALIYPNTSGIQTRPKQKNTFPLSFLCGKKTMPQRRRDFAISTPPLIFCCFSSQIQRSTPHECLHGLSPRLLPLPRRLVALALHFKRLREHPVGDALPQHVAAALGLLGRR